MGGESVWGGCQGGCQSGREKCGREAEKKMSIWKITRVYLKVGRKVEILNYLTLKRLLSSLGVLQEKNGMSFGE